MSSNRRALVAAFVLAAGMVLAGLALIEPSDSGTSAAAAPTGEPGVHHRNWTFQNVGWVDIAINVTPELDKDDVHITVAAEGIPRPKPDRGGIWTCWIAAPSIPQPFARSDAATGWCYVSNFGDDGSPGDERWEYGVQYGDHRQGVAIQDPSCRVFDCSTDSKTFDVTTDAVEEQLSYADFRNESKDSVLHWTVMTGGVATGQVEVDATYRGTTVNVTYGPPSDLFSYQRDDFDAQRAIWTEHHAYRHNATLSTRLETGPDSIFFSYSPLSPGGREPLDEGPVWYTAPDGRRRAEPFGLMDVSAEDGAWAFGYEQSGGRHADMPVLYGAGYQWADLPE